MPIFATEVHFYDVILKKVSALRSEAGLTPLRLAESYYASDEEGVIIFENIKTKGYEVIEKTCKTLEGDSLEKVIIALAEFHATGHHMIHSHPGGVEGFMEAYKPLYKEMNMYELHPDSEEAKKQHHEFLESVFVNYGAILKDIGEEELGDKMNKQVDIWLDKVLESVATKPGDLLTFRHGDIWYNNVMFKYVLFFDHKFICSVLAKWEPICDTIHKICPTLGANL